MKRILLVNECESDNLGDLAIARSLEDKVASLGFKTKKATFSSVVKTGVKLKNPTKSSRGISFLGYLSKIKALIALKWFILNYSRVQRAFIDVDKVIIGGGQLILSNPHFPTALFLWVISSRFRKVPVYIVGVGCGNSFTFLESKMIKYSLNKVNKIFLRDIDSVHNLQKNFSVKADLSFDCAYESKDSRQKRESLAVVSIISYSVFERYKKESKMDISNQDEFHLNWLQRINALAVDRVVFISTTTLDCFETKLFLEKFGNEVKHDFRLVDQLTTLDEYETEISTAAIVLSARMHSLILAENYGCEIDPWVVSEKLGTYAERYPNYSVKEKSLNLRKTLQEILNEK